MPVADARDSYQVISRRYRPQVFRDVIGQRAVVKQLHNEIEENRVGQGYLFCGPRGTGKTSMARIFAKALNCASGPTNDPCGRCDHCLEIAAGTHLDVIEVDAATYTKVDSTRELLEGIARSPFKARHKVYIIDEVHMLSNHSFNALLKSLEEPPPNVVFVLATTNPEKIPETVVSRCRRCTFERIQTADIIRSLDGILAKEGITVPEDEKQGVLQAIALASDGGLRDAQVFLDQLISVAGGTLTLDVARSLLGVVEADLFVRLFTALVERDCQACLELVRDLVERGRDLPRFVKMFLSFLRDLMLLKVGGSADLLKVTDGRSPDVQEILHRATLPFILNAIQQFLDLEERLKGAAPARFLVEFTLIKLTAIDPRLVLDGSASSGGDGGAARRPAPRQAAPAPTRAPLLAAEPPAPVLAREAAEELEQPPAIEEVPTTDADRWDGFVAELSTANAAIASVLRKARLVDAAGSRLVVELAAGDRSMEGLLNAPDNVRTVREAARRVWARPLMPEYRLPSLEAAAFQPAPLEVVLTAEERVLVSTPRPKPEASNVRPGASRPVGEEMTLEEAFEKFPALREACALVEQHFGAKPTAWAGRSLRG